MYSYEDRIRAVKLSIKLGKRLRAAKRTCSKELRSPVALRSKATLNKPSKISAQTWMTQFFGLLCLSRGPFGQFAGR